MGFFWYFVWESTVITHHYTIGTYGKTGNDEIIDNKGVDRSLVALKR